MPPPARAFVSYSHEDDRHRVALAVQKEGHR